MCNALVLKYKYVDSIQLKFIRTVYLKERINLPPILACVNWEDQSPRIRDETDLGHGGSWYYCLFLFLLEILPKNKQTKNSSDELEHTNTSLFSYIHILVLEKGRKGGTAN